MSREEIEQLLVKVNHHMLDIKKGDMKESCPIGIIDFNTWEWPQGVGLYGMFQYYLESGDTTYLNHLISWYDARIAEGLPEKNVNTMAPMLTLAYLYEETHNESYRIVCAEWADWIMKEMIRTEDGILQHMVSGNLNPHQVWDDTLFMTVLFLAKWSVLTGNKESQEEAIYQFLMHIQYLYDTKTGLWFHGWNFEGRHHFANALWARGNCWITVGIPEFIEIMGDILSPSTKHYLINTLKNQIQTLEKVQTKDGMWNTLLDDPNSYVEASATAGFGCGILKSIRLGFIDDRFIDCGMKALHGLLQCIEEDGNVTMVSYGTGMGRTLDDYRKVPLCSMAYGQSLTVLFLCEVIKII